MLFIFKKRSIRKGEIGEIARWIGDRYLEISQKSPDSSLKENVIEIAQKRYPSGEFDPGFESDNCNISLTSRILEARDLHDLAITFIRREIGKDYENDTEYTRLMYAVIFEEIIEKGIPRSIAMIGQ